MRLQGSRRSENVEDRRGMSVGRGVAGGGGAILIILLISWLLGADPTSLLTQVGTETGGMPAETGQAPPPPAGDAMADFVSAVLGETEDVWREIFRRNGERYRDPRLVLFSGSVRSACGLAGSATGPFYCPGDEKVYLDMAFFSELSDRYDAPGDFAHAYVIAHEVGHHVQNLLGITDRVHSARGRVRQEEYNELSVRLELQADFLAGVWAHHAERARRVLEEGDIEEALNAASQIGDDRMQMRARGYVAPDSFTHGSGEQRVRWFTSGLQTGELKACDTFNTARL